MKDVLLDLLLLIKQIAKLLNQWLPFSDKRELNQKVNDTNEQLMKYPNILEPYNHRTGIKFRHAHNPKDWTVFILLA